MKAIRVTGVIFLLAALPASRAQSTDEASPVAAPAKPEDAQVKAIREQLAREAAEAKAVIDADIARNPNGANALAARKAAEEKKAAEQAKLAVEEKAKADADDAAKVAATKAEDDRKAAEAAWKAGAPERAKAEAQKKAAVEKWRKSAKPGPSIMMGHRADGSVTVMVDGKVSVFATDAEAKAFVDKAKDSSDSTLSY